MTKKSINEVVRKRSNEVKHQYIQCTRLLLINGTSPNIQRTVANFSALKLCSKATPFSLLSLSLSHSSLDFSVGNHSFGGWTREGRSGGHQTFCGECKVGCRDGGYFCEESGQWVQGKRIVKSALISGYQMSCCVTYSTFKMFRDWGCTLVLFNSKISVDIFILQNCI